MSRFFHNALADFAKPLLAVVAFGIVSYAAEPVPVAAEPVPAPVPVSPAEEAPAGEAPKVQSEAEVQSQADAPADSEKASKRDDAESAPDEKFNPLLIRNNPKAHVYALSLRGPVVFELGFAKQSVDFTPDEFKLLTEKAQDMLFEVAAEYAMRSGKLNGGQFYLPGVGYGQGEDVVGPLVARVREALVAAMSPDQRARYLLAAAQQDSFRRDACLELVVSRLEICLSLTDEQREKIAAELDKAWNPRWQDSGALQHAHSEGIPDIPNSLVVPHLDPEQVQAWESQYKDSYYTRNMSDKMPADIPWDYERHR